MKKIILKLLLVVAITCIFALGRYLWQNYDKESNYCYARWAPHGQYWYQLCHSSKKDCQKELESDSYWANTKKCYIPEYTDAYCVRGVKTGKVIAQEEDIPAITVVCTKKKEECEKYIKYSTKDSSCEYISSVSTRETDGLYLNSKKELDNIVKNNFFNPTIEREKAEKEKTKREETKNKNSSKCTKYEAAPDQQKAFENLELNWNKTKKWGAFVDTNGNLRANKPSCRLIERDSEEYNRYK